MSPRKASSAPPHPEPSPSTSSSTSEVKTRMLRAALELFAERGFASTTTAEIARRAEVAEKTIFAHFKTKDALYEQTLNPATLDLLIPEASTASPAFFDAPATLEEFLRALMRNRIALFRRHPAKFKLIMQELLLRPERARRFFSEIDPQFHRGVEGAFRRLQAKGELRDMPMSQLHRIGISALLGYAINCVVFWPDRAWDDDAEIEATISALVSGLRPRETTRASRPPRTKRRRSGT